MYTDYTKEKVVQYIGGHLKFEPKVLIQYRFPPSGKKLPCEDLIKFTTKEIDVGKFSRILKSRTWNNEHTLDDWCTHKSTTPEQVLLFLSVVLPMAFNCKPWTGFRIVKVEEDVWELSLFRKSPHGNTHIE